MHSYTIIRTFFETISKQIKCDSIFMASRFAANGIVMSHDWRTLKVIQTSGKQPNTKQCLFRKTAISVLCLFYRWYIYTRHMKMRLYNNVFGTRSQPYRAPIYQTLWYIYIYYTIRNVPYTSNYPITYNSFYFTFPWYTVSTCIDNAMQIYNARDARMRERKHIPAISTLYTYLYNKYILV